MPRIHPLSTDLISKIAAGEVIERPCYAVKELLENSLDANATSIHIELENAGLSKIKISDNGDGMEKEDILECYKPHTTSKIKNELDLFSVNSMGFRGEALASIASISTLTIRSKFKDDQIGTEIVVEQGNVISFSPYGMPQGTQIVVENLFGNIPARKKFLTNTTTENKLITEIILSLALAHPKVSFNYYNNERKIVSTASRQTLLQRASELLGDTVAANLLFFENSSGYVKTTGYIGKPQIAVQSTSKQFMFVNGRKISDKNISNVLKSTYGTLLEPKMHPVLILFIDIPYERVDVNVHPRKEHVAFLDFPLILETLKVGAEKTLSSQEVIYSDLRWKKGEYAPVNYSQLSLREGGTESYAGKLLKQSVNPWNVEKNILDSSEIVQLHNLYLITQSSRGIVLIDQHAAHERILYEQFAGEFNKLKSQGKVYLLPVPISLDLSISEQQIADEHRAELEKLGFKLSWEETHFALQTIPAVLKDRPPVPLLKEILEDLAENSEVKNLDTKSHKLIAYLACRSAIKAGDKLTKTQAENLIKKLGECKNQTTCPHGRPVQIVVSLDELHTLFHRK